MSIRSKTLLKACLGALCIIGLAQTAHAQCSPAGSAGEIEYHTTITGDVTVAGFWYCNGTAWQLMRSPCLAGPTTYSTPGTYTYTVPAGCTNVTVEAYGAGGGAGTGGGGGGGSVVERNSDSSLLVVGGGGGGSGGTNGGNGGGGGGGYGSSNVSVTGGEQLDLWVGGGGLGSANGRTGGDVGGGAGATGSGGPTGGTSTYGGGGGADGSGGPTGGDSTYGGAGGGQGGNSNGGDSVYGGGGGAGGTGGQTAGTSTNGNNGETDDSGIGAGGGGGGGGFGTTTAIGTNGGASATGGIAANSGPGTGGSGSGNGSDGQIVITPVGGASLGACTQAGEMYYDSDSNTMRWCDGTDLWSMSGPTSSSYYKESFENFTGSVPDGWTASDPSYISEDTTYTSNGTSAVRFTVSPDDNTFLTSQSTHDFSLYTTLSVDSTYFDAGGGDADCNFRLNGTFAGSINSSTFPTSHSFDISGITSTGTIQIECDNADSFSSGIRTLDNLELSNSSSTVFLSSALYDGDLVSAATGLGYGGSDGVEAADYICQSLADAEGLSGSYMAWISTGPGDDPDSRFVQSTNPYLLVNGTKIADNWTDLTDGTLDAAINIDETGASVGSGSSHTYVGSNGQSAGADYCAAWTDSTGASDGADGNINSTSSSWTSSGADLCSVTKHLYCFEQGTSNGCSKAGAMNYDTTTDTFQYCNGGAWVDIGE